MVIYGPTGCGKTLLKNCMRGLAPELAVQECPAEGAGYDVCADLHIEVSSIPFREWASTRTGTTTANLRDRMKGLPPAFQSGPADWSDSVKSLLKQAYEELNLSVRALDAVVRVAGTIARLDQRMVLNEVDVAEAAMYRTLDRPTGREAVIQPL